MKVNRLPRKIKKVLKRKQGLDTSYARLLNNISKSDEVGSLATPGLESLKVYGENKSHK